MAVYKVPQDVEAEDKLIGPFSFRQFIYLIVVAISLGLAWFMSQSFIVLGIIPLPVALFFAILALPLRKDQPMEIYLAALAKFYMRPKKHMWAPEGNISLVTITAPVNTEENLTKDFTGQEANERLAYLAQVIDTQGWAARGVAVQPSSLSDDITAEASTVEDVMDHSTGVGSQFNSLIEEQEAIRHRTAVQNFQQAAQVTPAAPMQVANGITPQRPALTIPSRSRVLSQAVPDATAPSAPPVNPASNAATISAQPPQPTPQTASAITSSPAIIRLANNSDLSISAIAHEARRSLSNNQEVVISLH
ncbi:MAG: PrgI family protein [Candidatus Saccharimonadales bacterium]